MSTHRIPVTGRAAVTTSLRAAIALLLVTALVVAAGSGGCASDKNQPEQSRAAVGGAKKDTLRRTEPVDPFDLGAGRKPTPDTMYALARIMAARDQRTESMNILRNLIAQYPNYLPAYNALAETYMQIGQSDDAIATLAAGLKRAPDDAVLLNNLGMVWFLRENYDQALPYFEKAAEVRPEEELYRANKAAALGMLGRTRDARVEYRKILPAKDSDENVDILNRARRSAGAASAAPGTPGEAAAAGQPTPSAAAQP